MSLGGGAGGQGGGGGVWLFVGWTGCDTTDLLGSVCGCEQASRFFRQMVTCVNFVFIQKAFIKISSKSSQATKSAECLWAPMPPGLPKLTGVGATLFDQFLQPGVFHQGHFAISSLAISDCMPTTLQLSSPRAWRMTLSAFLKCLRTLLCSPFTL